MSYDSLENIKPKYASVTFLFFTLRSLWASFLYQGIIYPIKQTIMLRYLFFSFQELEESIRAKEKEVENVEQSGLSLIQNKKEEVSSAVMNTLQEINNSWASLDHMVKESSRGKL